jgi:CRISPR/Cas system CSM-associated protein Csm5 (group 7 of RAMP superfamily)
VVYNIKNETSIANRKELKFSLAYDFKNVNSYRYHRIRKKKEGRNQCTKGKSTCIIGSGRMELPLIKCFNQNENINVFHDGVIYFALNLNFLFSFNSILAS